MTEQLKTQEPAADRRKFLTAGITGAVVGSVAGAATLVASKPAMAAYANVPYPWITHYQPLDVELTRKHGYLGYYQGHCAYGSFKAIISQLADIVGAPFDQIPPDMMRWGAGGAAGFGSFCGGLNGACAAIGLILPQAEAEQAVSDLITWYDTALIPSATINNYVTSGEMAAFMAQHGRTINVPIALPQSMAESNLCHASVTNWCLKSLYASGSPERSERCARLAGDVAARAVELMNAVYYGQPLPGLPVPSSETGCPTCHTLGTNYAKGNFTRGKMNCETCHTDLKQVSTQGHHKEVLR